MNVFDGIPLVNSTNAAASDVPPIMTAAPHNPSSFTLLGVTCDADLTALLSGLVGYVIVIGSCMLKVPQIMAIIKNRNANGISLLTYLIDTHVYAVTASWGVAYGLPIATYGENVVVLVQVVIVDMLIASHLARTRQVAKVLAVVLGGAAVLSYRPSFLPSFIHEVLFALRIVFILIAKVPQVLLIRENRSVGSLSLTTCVLAFVGGVVRVVTTAVEVEWAQGKLAMMVGFAVAAILTGVILLQFYWYRRRSSDVRVEVKSRLQRVKRGARSLKERVAAAFRCDDTYHHHRHGKGRLLGRGGAKRYGGSDDEDDMS